MPEIPSPRLRRLRAHAAQVTCPVERAIQVIGGRWRMLVLRSLLLDGPQRYNDLLRAIAGISPKELTRNLRDLEGLGLVSRDRKDAARTRYTLTSVGAELGPAFESLIPFGERLANAWQSADDSRRAATAASQRSALPSA
jgi:DNA-binding HxlR family transcriptional regulator